MRKLLVLGSALAMVKCLRTGTIPHIQNIDDEEWELWTTAARDVLMEDDDPVGFVHEAARRLPVRHERSRRP